MGKTYESLTPEHQEWLRQQQVFFVATAPLAHTGHINCSPKGGDTLRVVGEREVAFLDLTGSGIETVAHLQENGRIVLMFCAFAGQPKILRLHGQGTVVYPYHAEFARLQQFFPTHPAQRCIIRVAVTRISASCGFGVPLMDFVAGRDMIEKWSATKGPQGLAEYRLTKNRASVDGLPGYKPGA